MEQIELTAKAKINLGLDVCRRLENGYHEVRMIMQSVALSDTLRVRKRADEKLVLWVDSQDDLGEEKDNLVLRAARLMQEEFSLTQGLDIVLEKHIPVAAGLAGGSSDAAAMLKAMNALFSLGLELEQLQRLALRLGADIPFCLQGGTALSEGIGEILTPLQAPPQATVLLAKPPIMVSTREVYQGLKLEEGMAHPDISGMVLALQRQDLDGITKRMENILESVTVRKHPVIASIKEEMLSYGAKNALMSGSGPTVFGIFMKPDQARACAGHLEELGWAKAQDICVTTFCA